MFGFSLMKLLVLIAIIVAVLLGFRWFETMRRNVLVARRDRELGETVDLVRNPKTGAYEPRRRDDGG